MTREQWLHKMAQHLAKRFEEINYSLKDTKYRLSCGMPTSSGGAKLKAIGQCFSPSVSADHTSEIFISPTISGSVEVAATLAHELIHAVVGIQHGHKGPFRKCALALGLTGKMTATVAGDELTAYIKEEVEIIGEYPHAVLDTSKTKRQKGRLLKAQCTNKECWGYSELGRPYSVRISARVFELAAIKCPCCDEDLYINE